MSIQFNVCPLNRVSILREMFTDRMKSNIWWRCCVTATHWIAPPGTDAFAWYVCFLPQGSSQHFNIYIINLNWSGHSGVFWLLAHLPSQLLLHVVEVLAVFVPQAQQFNHVLCRIEGDVRLHHFKNPTKFSSDHLLLTCVLKDFFCKKRSKETALGDLPRMFCYVWQSWLINLARFVRSHGWKTNFEWRNMGSQFWGEFS